MTLKVFNHPRNERLFRRHRGPGAFGSSAGAPGPQTFGRLGGRRGVLGAGEESVVWLGVARWIVFLFNSFLKVVFLRPF